MNTLLIAALLWYGIGFSFILWHLVKATEFKRMKVKTVVIVLALITLFSVALGILGPILAVMLILGNVTPQVTIHETSRKF